MKYPTWRKRYFPVKYYLTKKRIYTLNASIRAKFMGVSWALEGGNILAQSEAIKAKIQRNGYTRDAVRSAKDFVRFLKAVGAHHRSSNKASEIIKSAVQDRVSHTMTKITVNGLAVYMTVFGYLSVILALSLLDDPTTPIMTLAVIFMIDSGIRKMSVKTDLDRRKTELAGHVKRLEDYINKAVRPAIIRRHRAN